MNPNCLQHCRAGGQTTSTPQQSYFGMKMFQFDLGIISGKLPVDRRLLIVSVLFPSREVLGPDPESVNSQSLVALSSSPSLSAVAAFLQNIPIGPREPPKARRRPGNR